MWALICVCSTKPLKRRRPKNLVQNAKHVHPLVLESDLPSGACELLDKADGMCSFFVSLFFFYKKINLLYTRSIQEKPLIVRKRQTQVQKNCKIRK